MESIFAAGVVVFIIILIVVAILNRRDKKESERLRALYNQALKGTDKKAALNAGRAYYSSFRRRKALTMCDEMIISNDLSTMNSTISNTHLLSLSKV